MSSLRPRTPCTIVTRTTKYDGNGRPIHALRKRRTKCSVVHLYDLTEKTTVRADSSASRGQAEEQLSQARLLFGAREQIKTGDLVEVSVNGGDNMTIEVTKIFRRMDVAARVHHIDVEGAIWVSK